MHRAALVTGDHLAGGPATSTVRVQRPRGLKDRAVLKVLEPMFKGALDSGAEALTSVIAEEVASRAASVGDTSEPDLTPTRARYLSAPVVVGDPVDSAVARSSSG